MLASKTFLPLPNPPTPHPPTLGHILSLPHFLDSLSPGTPPSWHPAPQAAGFAHRITGLGCMQQWQRTCSSTWQKPGSPPHWAGTGLVVTPAPKEGQTEGNKPKTEESHLGWRRRAEAPQGNGVHLMNASGLENGNGRGEAKGSDEGHGGTVRRTGKSSHAAWDKSFVALSDSQSINWCLLEPGTQGSVEERRAREEIRRTGMASCPGLHFAVIICTNSAKRCGVESTTS